MKPVSVICNLHAVCVKDVEEQDSTEDCAHAG